MNKDQQELDQDHLLQARIISFQYFAEVNLEEEHLNAKQ